MGGGGGGGGGGVSQGVLGAGFCDALWDAAVANRADAGASLFALRVTGVSAARRGGDAADPGGVFAGDQYAAGGPGGGAGDGRAGERTNGLDADQETGPRGETVPRSAPAGRGGGFILRRSESASASARRAQAGADAGGLRGTDGWATALAGLCAEPRGEPGRLGRSAAGPLSAGLARPPPPAHRDRRLPRFGGSNSDGVPARSAPAVLGPQDAEHSGESPEAGLRRGEDRCPGHLSGLAGRPRPAGLPAP